MFTPDCAKHGQSPPVMQSSFIHNFILPNLAKKLDFYFIWILSIL